MEHLITEERAIKFKNVIAKRQNNLTVILENVHDPHNIGAVIRSCDAVGITEIYVIYTEDSQNYLKQYIGINSASGAKKWVKVHFYDNLISCFYDVRLKYEKVFGTHLSSESLSLYNLDLCGSIGLMFGNERDGISEEARSYLDGNFIIPQYGMVQSLNISVACAVTLFEASRQRSEKGMYDESFDTNNSEHQLMFESFIRRHRESLMRKGQ